MLTGDGRMVRKETHVSDVFLNLFSCLLTTLKLVKTATGTIPFPISLVVTAAADWIGSTQLILTRHTTENYLVICTAVSWMLTPTVQQISQMQNRLSLMLMYISGKQTQM